MLINSLRLINPFNRSLIWLATISAIVCTATVYGQRFQTDPASFETINIRHENLFQSSSGFNISRPYVSTKGLEPGKFLFQFQPWTTAGNQSSMSNLSSWIQLSLGENVTIANEMVLEAAAENPSAYIGKEWRSVSGRTNQSFINWSNKNDAGSELNITAGRVYKQLGPGRKGQLLMGRHSRPLDQLSFAYEREIFQNTSMKFFYQTAFLDKINSFNRFFTLHRLEIIRPNYYMAITEGLLYSRKNQGVDLVYLNPFMFYHLEQLNGPDLAGNTLGTVEIGYNWKTHRAYLELLVDDVQLDNEVKGDLEPNELGLLVGYEYATQKLYLGSEIIGITNRTYKTPTSSEWFIHRNEPIGYYLGSDFAQINLLSRYYFAQSWHFDLEVNIILLGEGDFSMPWDEPWQAEEITMETGYFEPFPTGIVETSKNIKFEVMRHWSPERFIGLNLSHHTIQNVEHIEGQKDSYIDLGLTASWTIGFETILN